MNKKPGRAFCLKLCSYAQLVYRVGKGNEEVLLFSQGEGSVLVGVVLTSYWHSACAPKFFSPVGEQGSSSLLWLAQLNPLVL